MYRAISLGWGVQSWTLAAMSALGELPPVSVAIHADTTHEMQATYEFAATWAPWLEERGVQVATVVSTGRGGTSVSVEGGRGGKLSSLRTPKRATRPDVFAANVRAPGRSPHCAATSSSIAMENPPICG